MNYQELSSKMRVKPSFASAEEVIKKDYPLKLPNRTSLHIWNSPEISQFMLEIEEVSQQLDLTIVDVAG